jgi:hypothetical protein
VAAISAIARTARPIFPSVGSRNNGASPPDSLKPRTAGGPSSRDAPDVISSPEIPPNERKPSGDRTHQFLAGLRRRRDWYVARTMTPRTLINDIWIVPITHLAAIAREFAPSRIVKASKLVNEGKYLLLDELLKEIDADK